MLKISIEVPDTILEFYKHNTEIAKKEMVYGIIIWEYLNGHLTLKECGEALNIGYRGFLELLWKRGIPIDALDKNELEEQISILRDTLQEK